MTAIDLPTFMLYVDTYEFLVCTICEHALFTSDPASHALKHLPTTNITSVRATLGGKALQSPDFAYEVIKAQQLIRPINGLPIRDGFRCTRLACFDIFTSELSACKHITSTHNIRGRANQLKALQACKTQGL